MTAATLQFIAQARIDPRLLSEITGEVARVEEELREQVKSQIEMVERVARLTLEAGGKRLRPAFVSLAAKATGEEFSEDRAVKLGACLELIHMATLIHDDVIDNSATRRGRPTAGAEFGNTAAILSGDVLLAKAMGILAYDRHLEITQTVTDAVIAMAEGEVHELEARGDFDLAESEHFEIMRRKTAAFIQACCVVGARLATANPRTEASLAAYGHHIGIAFQIVDDILDYRGDRKQTGKPIGTDFRDGQATLPLIYLRDHLTEGEGKIARRRFGHAAGDDEIRMISDWMDTRGAYARAESEARRHVDAAHAALAQLPEGPARDVLHTVAEYVMERNA